MSQHMPGCRQPARWISVDVVLVPAHEQLRVAGYPWVVGGDVVGHVIEKQALFDVAGGQGSTRRRQRLRAAEGRVNDVPAHAVR